MACSSGNCGLVRSLEREVEELYVDNDCNKKGDPSPREIFENFKDAVVKVTFMTTQSNTVAFTGGAAPTLASTEVFNNAYPVSYDQAGFIYRAAKTYKHSESFFVVTSTDALMYLNLLVPYYSTSNIFNGLTAVVGATFALAPLGTTFLYSPSLVDIFVSFNDVNDTSCDNKNFVYKGELAGVELNTGLAIVRIPRCNASTSQTPTSPAGSTLITPAGWNYLNSKLTCTKYLLFGNSLCASPGAKCYVIDYGLNSATKSLYVGNVVCNREVQTDSTSGYELLKTDIGQLVHSGAPILDDKGYIIGVATSNLRGKAVSGISEFTARRILDALVCTAMGRKNPNIVPNSTVGVDTAGNTINQFIRGSLNAVYSYATAANKYRYELNTLGISMTNGSTACPSTRNACAHAPPDRRLEGILIRGFTAGSPLSTIVQGVTIQVGDIIEKINGVPLGMYPPQVSLDTLLYDLTPDATVDICFRKAADLYCTSYKTKLQLVQEQVGTTNIYYFLYNNYDGYFSAPIRSTIQKAYSNGITYVAQVLIPYTNKSTIDIPSLS